MSSRAWNLVPVRQMAIMAAVMATIAAGLTSACGEAAESPAPPSGSSAGTVNSIAMLLPGKKNDPGFSSLGTQALEKAAKKYGIDRTAVVESVDVAQQEETYRSLAEQGYQLIVGWGGQFEDGAKKAAQQFPDVKFSVMSGKGNNGKNYASVAVLGEEWSFLEGYVMARVSRSKILGIVTGSCTNATSRTAHGVRAGARLADPATKVLVATLESFDDPSTAKEAALAQIAAGADVIMTDLNTGNVGVFRAAEQNKAKRVLVTTQFADQHADAPEVVLTSALRDTSGTVSEVVRRIKEGTFGAEPIQLHLTATEQALAPFRGLAPEAIFAESQDVQKKIVAGEIKVETDTTCPIKSD